MGLNPTKLTTDYIPLEFAKFPWMEDYASTINRHFGGQIPLTSQNVRQDSCCEFAALCAIANQHIWRKMFVYGYALCNTVNLIEFH